MKYVIILKKNIDEKHSNSIFINKFDNRDQWQNAILSLMDALIICECNSHVDYELVTSVHIATITTKESVKK